MTKAELEKAMASTQKEVSELKQCLNQTTDPEEQRKLSSKIKELRYLQLWHIGQLESCDRDK